MVTVRFLIPFLALCLGPSTWCQVQPQAAPGASRPTPGAFVEVEAGKQAALHRLKEIRVPMLILVGDADIPDVHAHAGAIEAGIPGSKRVVIPEAGHLMYLEKPEEFSRVVITFIETKGP